MNPRDAAEMLLDRAKEQRVRFPKVWDESKLRQTCGATVMLYREGDGYNIDSALQNLIEKYETEEPPVALEEGSKKTKKRKKADENGDEAVEDGKGKSKKERKSSTVAHEENRPVAEAIQEMAAIYFKNKDTRKGGVFSKAAKAIRECETYISNKKDAMELKGVGKGIATYVEEMLEKGCIMKLEELRAGNA